MRHRAGKKGAAIALSALLCVPIMLGALAGCADGGTMEQSKQKDTSQVTYYGLGDVEITDAYAVNGLDKEIDYLLELNADKLLYWFYRNAKLQPKASESYGGGWEGALIGGHTLGHYLTALAQAYANAGTSAEDKAAIGTRIEYILDALKECQDNATTAGANEGFLWGSSIANAYDLESQFNAVEAGRGNENIGSVAWVPWYTMHKILAGLIDLYTVAGNAKALEIATKLGDWTYNRVSKWSAATKDTVLGIEYGGMNDCLYNLYAVTGEAKYAVAAHQFDEESLFTAVLNGNRNYLNNRHANTTIPKIIGALNGYIQLTANPVQGIDVSDYLEVARCFWTDVLDRHSYVTGGNSEWEHFGEDYVLDAERTNANCETCNTYNMLKLTRMLFSEESRDGAPTGEYARDYLDYYENTYYNAIWSSQNPVTGMTTYFQPMASGYFKVYSTAENSFWCCTGSGMESFTKLNDSIYFTAGNATYVSLYVSSVVKTPAVSLTQTADLENSDTVTIKVDDGSTVLRLRRPAWSPTFAVKVNSAQVEIREDDCFVSVDVKKGDTVTVELQKTVTAHGLPDVRGNYPSYAFKYGPYVLSAELGTEGMTTTTTGVSVTIPETAVKVKTAEVSASSEGGKVEDFLDNIGKYMIKGADGKFTLNGTTMQTPYVFSYHFRQYQQRYAIYIPFGGYGKVEEDVEPFTWVTQDTTQPGYGQYEVDELHAMTNNGSVGATNDGTYRYAPEGASFTYRMAVDKSTLNRLVITLRKDDNSKSLLVKAGATELYRSASRSFAADKEQVYIELPEAVVNAAHHITANGKEYDVVSITFSSISGESAKVNDYIYSQRFVNNTLYFVDCGDYTPTTTSAGDYFGMYNSVTDQAYGADAKTGKMWGVVDNHGSNIAGAPAAGKGFGTNSTWAFEFNDAGSNVDKTNSNRYTKNQTENGVSRNLHYWFELEDGTYVVEFYLAKPWPASGSADVTANGTKVVTNAATGTAVQVRVTVTGGTLKLDFTSSADCINLAYIRIMNLG